MDSPSPVDRRRASSQDRSGPSLLLLPLALLVGTVVGFATLGAHQDAVRPPGAATSAHSAGASAGHHHYDVHPAMLYLGALARRAHL